MNCSLFPDKIEVSFTSKSVTRRPGVVSAARFVRHTSVFKEIAALFEKYAPRPLLLYRYSHQDLLLQTLSLIFSGDYQLTAVEHAQFNPIFRYSTRTQRLASAPTLSRFFSTLGEVCNLQRAAILEREAVTLDDLPNDDHRKISCPLMDSVTSRLLDHCLEIVAGKDPKCIVIDVDSTPIALNGNQEMRKYDGAYQETAYLPIFVTINGVAAFAQNAPGATNGAHLMLNQVEALLDTVQERFPGKLVVIRADTGYNNDELICRIEDKGAKYVIGCNAAGGRYIRPQLIRQIQHQCALSESFARSLPTAVLELFGDPKAFKLKAGNEADAEPFRCCGVVRDYQAQSWSQKRTVIYRLNYTPEHKDEANLRYIQTNLTVDELCAITQGRGERKGRSAPVLSFELAEKDAKYAVELYEALFCDRGQDERLNCEWKSECYASKCSLSGFFANSIRMAVCVLAMQFMARINNAVCPHGPRL